MSFLPHILRRLNFTLIRHSHLHLTVDVIVETVEGHAECSLQDKIDLAHLVLLMVDVPIFRRVVKLPWHEAKRNLIHEVLVVVLARLKEILESFCIQNIFEQELTHDMLLNLVRHRVEVRFLLLENRCPVFVPVVVKV